MNDPIYSISDQEHFTQEEMMKIEEACKRYGNDLPESRLVEAWQACKFYGFLAPLSFGVNENGWYFLYNFIHYPYYDEQDTYLGASPQKVLDEWEEREGKNE